MNSIKLSNLVFGVPFSPCFFFPLPWFILNGFLGGNTLIPPLLSSTSIDVAFTPDILPWILNTVLASISLLKHEWSKHPKQFKDPRLDFNYNHQYYQFNMLVVSAILDCLPKSPINYILLLLSFYINNG